MGDDLGTEPPEDDGPEVMVGMVMGQDQPPDRLWTTLVRIARPAPLPAAGWPGRRYDHDPRVGHHEPGIGAAFGPTTGVPSAAYTPAASRRTDRVEAEPSRRGLRAGDQQVQANRRRSNKGQAGMSVPERRRGWFRRTRS